METSLQIKVLKSVESVNNKEMLKQERVVETQEFRGSGNQQKQNTINRYKKRGVIDNVADRRH